MSMLVRVLHQKLRVYVNNKFAGWIHQNNNFDLMRLLLASIVIVAHSFPLFLGRPEPWEALGSKHNSGTIAVMAFFVISGLLVTRSAVYSRSGLSYAISRIYRLVPGAFVCAIWMVFILGAVFTTLTLVDYFLSSRIWSFLIRNTLMMSIQYDLPGVFLENVYAGAVNGSLWSLKIEIRMYIAFGILVFVARQFPWVLGKLNYILLAVLALALIRLHVPGTPISLSPEQKPYLLWTFGYYFAAGAVLYAWVDKVPRNLALSLLFVGAAAALVNTQYYDLALRIALPYFIHCLAFTQVKPMKLMRGIPDISYGVYIYGFPVQQGLSALYSETLGFWTLTILALLISFILGAMSWYFVEAPALRNKRRGEDAVLLVWSRFKMKLVEVRARS